MAKFEYRFPELGEGLHEGEIVKMHIKPGSAVTDEDIIMEVQNDKAIVEVPCPVNGKVLEVLVKDGQVCHVGDIVAIIDAEGEVPEQAAPPADSHTASAGAAAPSAAPVQAEAPKAEAAPAPVQAAAPAKAGLVLATPSVRKYSREKNVDLAIGNRYGQERTHHKRRHRCLCSRRRFSSTCSRRRSRFVSSCRAGRWRNEAGSCCDTDCWRPDEERVPFKGIRKIIANAMVKSVYTAPHVTLMDEVDVTALVALRTKAKPVAEKKGIKLTYLPFIVKALVAACRQFPHHECDT